MLRLHMNLGRVIGTVVATQKHEGLEGKNSSSCSRSITHCGRQVIRLSLSTPRALGRASLFIL